MLDPSGDDSAEQPGPDQPGTSQPGADQPSTDRSGVEQSAGEQPAAEPDAVAELPLLAEPRDGVPDPIVDRPTLQQAAAALAAGSGPVAVDAERASGYRYSQRAYLVQLRRAGAGTFLIDPIEAGDLSVIGAAVADAEWVLHAANQDLPCLAELGMRPTRLFDTELAGRLLGVERVALGTMVETHLGVRLEKGHSAADWSTRPLPYDWLVYAALDVELLVELRDVLAGLLDAAGKLPWAAQEFEAVRTAPPAAPREEPWRRLSGIHALRNRRSLAVARELWIARDQYAAARDVAPGRTLPDAAVVDAARTQPASAEELGALKVFSGPRQRRQLDRWYGAVSRAMALPDGQLPALTGRGDGVPPAARWRERDPAAAARLAVARAAVAELAETRHVLAQNLLASDVLRRLCWDPPAPPSTESVAARLTQLGARPWQVELCGGPLATALATPVSSP